MAAYLIIIVLAAFGFLCALWVVFGFLLSGHRGASTVCLCKSGLAEEPVIRRYLWLYHLGLLKSPILLVDCGLSQLERRNLSQMGVGITLCSPNDLLILLKQERDYLD